MPTYCFTNDDGITIERVFSMGEAPPSVETEEGVFKRDVAAEHSGFRHAAGIWPMRSDAAGCHPGQRREYYEDSVKRGVPTQFDSQGRAIFNSREHRRRYCESRGIYDRNGGFGDPQSGKGEVPNREYLAE